MKKLVISLLLLAVVLTGMTSVYASGSTMSVRVLPTDTEVQVGDTVEYTILATGRNVVAMQFTLRLPEGLRYVPGSAATPEGLAQKLGVPAAEWTEQSGMFTFYNDVGIIIPEGTQLLRFSCVAEKEGEWTAELFELLPFDNQFQAFTPELQVGAVRVTQGAGETEPTEPAGGETKPAVTDPVEPDAPTMTEPAAPDAPKATEPTTPQPEAVPGPTGGAPEDETFPELTQPTQNPTDSAQDQVTGPENQMQPGPNKTENGVPIWLWLAGIVILITGGVVLLIVNLKKRS